MVQQFRLLSLLFLLTISASIANAQLTFDHATAPGTLNVLSDLDGNAVLDIIGSPDPTRLQVSLAGAPGTFLPPVTYPMKDITIHPKGISGITVNDFNGDDAPDVLVSTAFDFELFLGETVGDNFSGALRTPSITIPAPHRNYIFLASMDVNHDNKADLVFADLFQVSVKLGHGDGTFAGATTIYSSIAGTTRSIEKVAIGNFDGDGNGDIAIYEEQLRDNGTEVPRLTVLYGNGKGGFTQVHQALTERWGGEGLTAVDIDADGKTDLLTFNSIPNVFTNPVVKIFHGRASRIMTEQKVPVATGTNIRTNSAPVAADFDGDGRNDIAFITATPNFSLFHFTYVLGTSTGFSAPGNFAITPNGNNPQFFAVGNLNGDGRKDFVLHTTNIGGANTLDFLFNTNTGKHIPRCATGGRGAHEVAICSPPSGFSVSQNTRFSLQAHAFIPITRLELWVDGKKIHQTFHDWSEINIPLTLGNHHFVGVAVTIDGDTVRNSSDFLVSF